MTLQVDTVRSASRTLAAEGVAIRLGGRLVVEDCSFELEPGKLTAMLGPSGCGKSTLAFLLAGYHRPTAGSVTFAGAEVRGPSAERLLVFQETSLMPWLTAEQNVMFGPRSRRVSRAESREQARAILSRVGLADFAHAYPGELSGGMQRRVELARALINEPAVLVLDEPFRGLDALTRGRMQEYYAELYAETGVTTLFITTEIDEAILLADRLLLMTNLPTRVREVIDVDLPRPRDRQTTLLDPLAREIKQRALAVLHAEALKTFAEPTTPATKQE